MYPKFLQPTNRETFVCNDKKIDVPKCLVKFDQWTGEPISQTFGGKPLLSVDNTPMFAELAIMTSFVKDGWQSRWVETYGKSNKEPIFLTDWKDDSYRNQVNRPIIDEEVLRLLALIAHHNNDSYAGCWDVLAWKEGNIIFAESKRIKKDSIRSTQTNWLMAGLKSGLTVDNFLVVQWDM